MKRLGGLLLVATLAFAAVASPASAVPSGGSVTLGFGETYLDAGASRTHRGADVAAREGEQAETPVSGTVRFAGRVPAADGGTVCAVTIECDQGRVTLLPLENLSVTSGASVSEGEAVGTIAPRGDGSSAATHVHVSLRRGDLYVDPTPLLAVAPQSGSGAGGQTATQPEGSQQPASPSPVSAPISTPVAVEAPQPSAPVVGVPCGSPSQGAVTVAPGVSVVAGGASARVTAPRHSAAVTRGAVAVATHAASVRATARGVETPPARVVSPYVASSRRPTHALRHHGTRTQAFVRHATTADGWWQPAVVSAAAAAVVAVIGGLLLARLSRRIERFEPVSDRLGKLLQQLRAGDTICGLNSCSGHSAFTVPEPLAQRR